jgi:acyl-CoA oxidase
MENIAPIAVDYWERAEFPIDLVKKIALLGICGSTVKEFGCPGLSHMANVAILLELARVDPSTSTFFLVHNCLAVQSIALCGNIDQKNRYLPALAKLDKIGCFALSEPDRGSDASDLETTATPANGGQPAILPAVSLLILLTGWIINGQKRWIGNSTFADVFIVWAKHAENNKVLGFIVDKGTSGLSVTKIDNKISLRIVQNGNITFENCFVPETNRMPGAKVAAGHRSFLIC